MHNRLPEELPEASAQQPGLASCRVAVVGIGADGALAAPELVLDPAAVVIGAPRHLALLPDVPGQRRHRLPTPLAGGLADLLARHGHSPIVVMASGDPLVHGIGAAVIGLIGADRVAIHPALSSVSLARAAMGWPADSCAVVRVIGDEVSVVARELAPGRRILVLSSDERSPALIARLLVDSGYGASSIAVLGDLGSDQHSRTDFASATALTVASAGVHMRAGHEATEGAGGLESGGGALPRLNIVAIACRGPRRYGWSSGLPDAAFEHDGQITKRDLRASALARLAPVPGEHLWDVGAGCGSVGIEWLRCHTQLSATAIEAESARAQRISRNCHRLGVPRLRVVEGRAPMALVGLDSPDAIFVGGGAGEPGLLEICRLALPPGGRLVVHAVTMETEQLLARNYAEFGGELTRHSIEIAAPLGSFTGFKPLRAVTQWTWTS